MKEAVGLNMFYVVDLESVLRQPSRTPNPAYNSLSQRTQRTKFSFLLDIWSLAESCAHPFPGLSPRRVERYHSPSSDAWMSSNPGTLPKPFRLLSLKNDCDV